MPTIDLFLPPGKHVPSRHTHPIQEERFTILAGTMRFRLGWRRILATPGDTIAIPAGVAHWFGNAGSGVVHARVEVRPALRMEELFATAATIDAGTQRSIRHWVRQLPAVARLLIEFQREVAVPDLAAWLVPWARELADRAGVSVLLPEYRGYGGIQQRCRLPSRCAWRAPPSP